MAGLPVSRVPFRVASKREGRRDRRSGAAEFLLFTAARRDYQEHVSRRRIEEEQANQLDTDEVSTLVNRSRTSGVLSVHGRSSVTSPETATGRSVGW